MRILVTGGTGFIGSHLAQRLSADKNNEITLLGLGNAGKPPAGGNVRRVNADITDAEAVSRHVGNTDIIYHLAGNSRPEKGLDDTGLDMRVNFLGTYNVLEAMRKKDVKEIVFFSSVHVYGNTDALPTPESHAPLKPVNMYGASKIAAEGYVSAFASSFGMRAVIFRPGAITGKGGEGAVSAFVSQLIKGGKRLEVRGNCRQCRSYIHIDDLLDGVEQGIRRAGNSLEIYNIGSGDMLEVRRVAEIVADEMGVNAEIACAEDNGETALRLWGDIGRLKETGWKPKCNSERAVRKAVREIAGGK